MAQLNFPDPNTTQSYTEAGITWTWNDTLGVWSAEPSTGDGDFTKAEADGYYLSKLNDDTAFGEITFNQNAYFEKKVGIGTNNPQSKLHVVGPSDTTNTGATLQIDDDAPIAIDVGGTIALRGHDGSNMRTFGLIKGGKESGTADEFKGYLSFQTRTTGQANTAEHMRIDSSGNVGIGIDDPSSKLHVAGQSLFNGQTTHAAGVKLLNTKGAYSLGTDADGNVIEISSRTINVHSFGAVGDGVTNDRGAIQAAIDSIGPLGGTIYFPAGEYLIRSVLNINKSNVSLVGDGIGTKIVHNNASGSAIKVYNSTTTLFFFTLQNLQIKIAPTSGSQTGGAAIDLDDVTRVNIHNVYIDKGLVGLKLRGVTQCHISNLQVLYEDDNGGRGATGRRFIQTMPSTRNNSFGGDIFITNFNGRCGGNFDCEIGVQVSAVDGFWLSNSHIGNCQNAHMSIINVYSVKTVGILIENVWFDQTTQNTYGCIIEGTTSSTSGYVRFNNCTFLGSSANSLNAIDIKGNAGDISVNDCEIIGWGGHGIYAENTGINNRINNTKIKNCSLSGGKSGISIERNKGWTITNNKISGANHKRHISLLPACTGMYVNNNIVDGSTTDGISISDFTGSSISAINNFGFNPVGSKTISPPTSPWTYTNNYGYPIDLYVYGGPNGIAGTITKVVYKGQDLGNPMNSYQLRVAPGESTTITFTGNLYAYPFGI